MLVSLNGKTAAWCASGVSLAETPLTRARGLLGRAGLERGEGILLRPASSIHMWFMRFAIDAAFLDPDGRVLRIAETFAVPGGSQPARARRPSSSSPPVSAAASASPPATSCASDRRS